MTSIQQELAIPTSNPTRRQTLAELLRLAGPLIVSNMFFTLQISIDRLFLSWYDAAATGAAFAAAMVFFAPVMFLTSVANFTSTFVAQYLGADRPRRVGPVVSQALLFSLIGGLAFMTTACISHPIMSLAGHEPGLLQLEADYFFCLCFCALPMAVTAAITGMLAGLHRPGLVIWINALGCLINGVLDWILIFGIGALPPLGIIGAGWATVAGSFASMMLALAIWRRPSFRAHYVTGRLAFDLVLTRQFLRFALPNGLQSCFDVIAWTIFTLMVGQLGAAALSATSIVLIVNAFFFIPMIGMSQAVCVQVGRYLGEERPDLAQRSVWLAFAVAASVMSIMGLAVALVPDLFITLFRTKGDQALWEETAALIPMMLWFVAVYSFFDSMNLTFAFALRGAGDTAFVSGLTVLCGITLLVIPGYFVCMNGYSVFWAWVCATAYIAGLGLVFLARFVWGPWRDMRVIEPQMTEELALNENA